MKEKSGCPPTTKEINKVPMEISTKINGKIDNHGRFIHEKLGPNFVWFRVGRHRVGAKLRMVSKCYVLVASCWPMPAT